MAATPIKRRVVERIYPRLRRYRRQPSGLVAG